MDFNALKAPFPPEKVHWRVGATTKDKSKGMALAYIDARHVMERLDMVCSPAGWQCRYTHAQGTVVCEIGLHVPMRGTADENGNITAVECEWLWKADGAGATDVEAEKGSLSDAFKRAAVRWGIGRYLYDLPTPWVKLDEYKRIKQGEYATLRGLLTNGNTTPPEPTRDDPQELTGEPAPLPPEPGSFWKQESYFLPVPKNKAGDLDFKAWADKDYKPALRKALKERSLDELNKLIRDNEETVKQIWNDGIKGLWADIADCERKAREYVVNRANGRKAA